MQKRHLVTYQVPTTITVEVYANDEDTALETAHGWAAHYAESNVTGYGHVVGVEMSMDGIGHSTITETEG